MAELVLGYSGFHILALLQENLICITYVFYQYLQQALILSVPNQGGLVTFVARIEE